MERKLPEGWVEVSFTSIFDINGGTQPPKENFIYEPKDGYIRLLQIRDFGEKPVPTYIPESGYLRTCIEDDILIARYGASIGRIVSGQSGAYNVALAKVDIPNQIDKRFVFWLLKSPTFQQHITSFQRTAQNGFNKNDLAGIDILLPPLAEQKRIVAKLDEAFQYLDTLKAKLERIPEVLKNFHQAVLTQAVTGKLTDSNIEEWDDSTLADVIIGKPKNGYSAKPVGYETPFRVLTLTATTSGVFNPNFFKYFDEEISADSPFWLLPNDIIIQRGNTIDYVGVPAIYDSEPNQFIYPDLMIKVRAEESVILTKFLYLLLSSKESRSYLRERATGTTGNMPKINQPTLLSLPVKFPPLEEQKEIVKRAEALFAKADAIESYYATLKEKIDKLPQAILAKAFRGELVPQDPNDEPASVLLEKIKAAKAGVVKPAKSKKAKGGKQGELVL